MLTKKPATPAIAAKGKVANQTSQEFSVLPQEMMEKAKSLRGGKGQSAFNGPIFSLIKASLELGLVAVEQPENQQQLMKSLSKIECVFLKTEKSLDRQL